MTFPDLIGRTPLVQLERIPEAVGIDPAVRVLGKLEGNNPGGSVKDRAAWEMLQGALARQPLGIRVESLHHPAWLPGADR